MHKVKALVLLEILKIKDLKLPTGIVKKPTKQGSRDVRGKSILPDRINHPS